MKEEYVDELDDTLDDVEPVVDNPAELYEHFRVVVDKGQSQVRVDKYLFERLVNSSRNRIQKAADAGLIMANGKPVKSSYKVSRFMILCKSIRQEIHKMLHPNAVTMVRMNGKKVGADTMRSINIYFSAYVFIIIVSVLLVSLDNFDFATSFSGVLTTINNVGPGISQVGPTDNFHAFSALSKIVFSFDMLFGRLEIFPYLLILSPDLWRKRF